MPLIYCFILFCAIATTVFAAGPEKVATLDRQLWLDPIHSPAEFDRASQQEILAFARQLNKTDLTNAEKIKNFTGLFNINPDHVAAWITQTKKRLLENYAAACASCDVTDWQSLVLESKRPLPEKLKPWGAASEKFYQYYLYEQVRLAALFPRITSEISKLSSVQEVNGFELDDRHFLLTYDDGPSGENLQSGVLKNRTKALSEKLQALDLHAFFFVLGSRMQSVTPAENTYQQQCLGSHGFEHKSHQNWQNWASSLQKTRQELSRFKKEPYWFRPPYGQRSAAVLSELGSHNERVMLWNIDSQDWNRKLTDRQVQDRVLTLMLLWRRGIILYHDIHPRALQNLPAIYSLSTKAELQLMDCREFSVSEVP